MKNILSAFLSKKNQWLILLLIGILLVVIAIPTKDSSSQSVGMEEEDEIALSAEGRLEKLLQKMQNVGEVDVMITFKEDEQVQGIVVIADGGGNAVVVREITGVVQALFDVDSHKIKVIERNQNN